MTPRRRRPRRATPVRALVVTGAAGALTAAAVVPALHSAAGTRSDAAAPAVRLTAPVTATTTGRAPAAPTRTGAGRVLPGRYIVVLKDGSIRGATRAQLVSRSVARARSRGVHVDAQYQHVVAAYAARMTSRQATTTRQDPTVAWVEPDRVVTADATERNPDWGLDRIDQPKLPLDHAYTSDLTGRGVTAFVIDTGIRATHKDLSGRVGAGFTAVADGHGTDDCNGHGTHVAGTIGGTVFGVAKQVTLVPVRVLGCDGSGSTSGVIQGVDWVAAHATKPAVANMSLGGGASKALDAAVQRALTAGVTFAVAAGNSAADACGTSPARVPGAMTVGSTTDRDARSSFSNTGSCVDVFAPGSAITSDFASSDTATATLSGTSMASPHAAGVAALVLQAHPADSPEQVSGELVKDAAGGVLTGVGAGSPNRLLQLPPATGSGGSGSGSGAPAPSPSASTPAPSPSASTPAPSPSASSPAPPSGGGGMLGPQEQTVLDLVNQQRSAAGCQPLVANATLTSVARAHSTDMATRNFFSHTNPDGLSPFDRMRAAGYVGRLMGENIAAGYSTPAAVMDGWMNSAGHRANILDCGFTEIGIGYATGGSYRFYWTQDFGTR